MSGQGNRQDNRSRGNAAQLLEKYKSLARDAQLGGDRVQTEYFLQFADHYHRVLSESRGRFEEQRRQRGDYDGGEEYDDQDEMSAEGDDRQDRAERQDRPERQDRAQRNNRYEQRGDEDRSDDDRPRRPDREEPRERPQPRAEAEGRNGAEQRPRRPRTPRVREDEGEGAERIALDALPPAIAAEGEAAAPRRRTRRPRAEDDTDIAPAA